MAVFIEANYSKKLGLPQYSSHQYSVTIRTELTDVSQLAQASADLYAKLQQAVDTQIANPGLVPGGEPSASTAPATSPSGNSSVTPAARPPTPADDGELDGWKCSDRQRDLILNIVDEHRLDKTEVDGLARQRYSVRVNRSTSAERPFAIATGLPADTTRQVFRYTPEEAGPDTRGAPLGAASSAQLNPKVPTQSWEFWEQQ
jgi:hypothetical protein